MKHLKKDYKTKFKKVRSKIRRCKEKGLGRKELKSLKQAMIFDLANGNTNLDLMCHLIADEFNTLSEYVTSINAYLRSETDTYDYNAKLVYKLGQMPVIMKIIANRHKIMDAKATLKEMIKL